MIAGFSVEIFTFESNCQTLNVSLFDVFLKKKLFMPACVRFIEIPMARSFENIWLSM